MIFKPVLLKAIFDGRKTMTRRPGVTRYEVGKRYAIQPGMARPMVGRIEIVSIRTEFLGNITEDEARREGFDSRSAFVDYWTDLYGGFGGDGVVTRIEFQLVEQTRAICPCCDGAGTQPVSGGGDQ